MKGSRDSLCLISHLLLVSEGDNLGGGVNNQQRGFLGSTRHSMLERLGYLVHETVSLPHVNLYNIEEHVIIILDMHMGGTLFERQRDNEQKCYTWYENYGSLGGG